MEKHLKRLPPEVSGLVRCCRQAAEELGVPAYIVGGFVRDLVMGAPAGASNVDLDICVEGDGIAYARELGRRLPGHLTVHARFGTASLSLAHHHKIDVASTRQEVYSRGGALPLVSRSGLRDDLARRDFTINTLAVRLGPGRFGELVDLFGGAGDIRARRVRILHDASFIDDPTRILRAVRFEQRLGFSIEPHTLRCLKEALRLGVFVTVGPHRLRDEIVLMLKENHPLRQMSRLNSLAGLDLIHPGLKLGSRSRLLLRRAREQVAWFRRSVAHRSLEAWLVYLTALLHDQDAPALRRIAERFALRTQDSVRLQAYAHCHRQVIAGLRQPGLRPSQIYELLAPYSCETLVMLRAATAHPAVRQRIGLFLQKLHAVRVSVTGDELKDMGIAPGPAYQHLLRHLLHARLDGRIADRQAERRCAREWISQHS